MIKKLVTVFILLLAFLLGPSCRKTFGHGYIKGIVFEEGTHEPVAGASVLFQHFASESSAPVLWDSTYTDIEGKFVFYFKRQVNHEYYIYVHDKLRGNRSSDQLFKKKNDLEFELPRIAWLKFHIVKTGTTDNALTALTDNGSSYVSRRTTPVDTICAAKTKIQVGRSTAISWRITDYQPIITNTSFSRDTLVNSKDTIVFTIKYD
jgi:hypothetical protein